MKHTQPHSSGVEHRVPPPGSNKNSESCPLVPPIRRPHLQVRTVAGLRHRNLVRLLGYCVDYNASSGQQEQILVYEFVPAGDLSRFIHHKAGEADGRADGWRQG